MKIMSLQLVSISSGHVGLSLFEIAEKVKLFISDSGGEPVSASDSASDILIREERRIIDKVCFFYASSRIEYDEIRQDVLINIWRGMSRFRGECCRSTWVYRICLNTCVSYCRIRENRKNMLPLDMLYNIPSDDSADENVEYLYRLIATLSATDKALIMMWLDGYTYDEISDVAGYKRNTVATRLKRIKESLTNKAKQL